MGVLIRGGAKQMSTGSSGGRVARAMGCAIVAEVRVGGGYARVRLALADGRAVYFNRPADELVGRAGRGLAVGDEVQLWGSGRLPDAVQFDLTTVALGPDWWTGAPPAH